MLCAGCGVELVGHAACPGCGVPVSSLDGELRHGSDGQSTLGPALPDECWTLTAPESYALRYVAGGTTGVAALKLALKELIACQALVLHGARLDRRLLPGARGVWLLSDAPRLSSITAPALTHVLDAYTLARRRFAVTRAGLSVAGVLIPDLIRSATSRDWILCRYLKYTLAGELNRRGLLTDAGTYTEAGARAEKLLDRWLELGRAPFLRGHVHDMRWARAYLAGAGALLLEDAYPADDSRTLLSALERGGLIDDVGALPGLGDAFSILDASFASLFDSRVGCDEEFLRRLRPTCCLRRSAALGRRRRRDEGGATASRWATTRTG